MSPPLATQQRLQTCGCNEATVALLLNCGVLSLVAWSHWDAITRAPVLSSGIAIACSGLAIAAGKAVGKLRGNRLRAAKDAP